MLQTIKQKREEGFTIIEVLIVLAIAGLIMVVVFLAVPALQRNSRNNNRKTEANNLMSAISEVSSNNGGTFAASDLSTAVGNTKLSFYQSGDIKTAADATAADTAGGSTTDVKVKTVVVIPNYKCGDKPTDAATSQNRTTAVYYWVESGSSSATRQCVSS